MAKGMVAWLLLSGLFAAPCAWAPACRQEMIPVETAEDPRAAAGAPFATATRAIDRGSVAGLEWVYSQPAGVHFAKTETTVAQYRACVEAGGCNPRHHLTNSEDRGCNWGHPDRDEHPMNCVDWHGADAFCKWAGARLPTEEEWHAEASDRATQAYPWGNAAVTCDLAVWGDGNDTDGCGKDSTWPVCSKPAGNSASGLCDMSGNVWEWTSSRWDAENDWRVVRGGSWRGRDPEPLRAAGRGGDHPDAPDDMPGFRCARPR